ncbi:MFS general substrate transporter [Coniochaeta ligniaria NRRL 30616]|uniref:MFS general substrate transporter n=1 Tax=Coniochaeta ligniaria NRRL 30616 TaxID=1408157 RepID=A0A1J7JMH8_9PEZI|nr:MFS general substrate transporter [Coniochaeta ligniaria NRRL 30616]
MDTRPASPTPSASDKIDLERNSSTPPTPGKAESNTMKHLEYLLARHGTLELDPMPDMNDADPYNWPKAEKVINIFLVAFHAMMSFFTAACIQSSFENIAEDLGTSLQRVSYLVSIVIAVLGVAPIIWRPLSERFGRRPILILSLIFSAVGNIGCAVSPSYATMGLCRAITAFFISPAAAIGSAVVSETFFKRERATYIGVWTLMLTLGVPVAPFIFGFVTMRVGYRWTYWILAITNGAQLLLYVFLGPETRYMRGQTHSGSTFTQEYLRFKRIDPTPIRLSDFLHPFTLFTRSRVLLPTLAYAMVFCLGAVFTTLEIPQLYVEKFHLNPQQMGLQYISIIVGSVIGEQLGGVMSDRWMRARQAKVGPSGRTVAPEYRLWLSYGGYLLAIVGIVVFVVQTDRADSTWNVTPDIGAGIAAAGNQIVTTVLITYAVDCYREEAASVGVFVTFVRQMWGFIGPFWFPEMIRSVGLSACAGIMTAMIVAVSVLPTIYLQFWKGNSRVRQ